MDSKVRNKKRVVINPGGDAYEIAVDGVRVVKFRARFQAIAWCQGKFSAKDIKINDYWDPTFSELPRSPEYKNFADREVTYADARSTIENLYSKLNKLFDTKLSNYAYYKNGDAAVGISGRSGKLCFVEVDRTVLVKDNPLQINSEIKSLLDEAKSLASNYVGMKIKDGNTIYIGSEPKITFINGNIKTNCKIYMKFEEIEMN